MIKAPIPENDFMRVQNLHELAILDTPEEDEFTDIVELASHICNMPISLISLVDESRQWFKAKKGVSASETSRDISFCGHAIAAENNFFEVIDAIKDERFFDNPLVISDPEIRFYAGVQLISRKGFKIGMLCVNDNKPGKLSGEQIFALKVLGNHVAKLLDLRITRKHSEEKTAKIQMQNNLLTKMVSIITHDVRGPIGSIKTAVDMSDAHLISEEAKTKLYGMFSKQIATVLNLLNNLVDWGNIQIQGSNIKQGNKQLKQLMDEEFETFRLSAELKNNTLVNLVDESVVLNADYNMVKFVLRNLINNANKFTQNGKITVYSDADENNDIVFVSDTGIGMTQENLTKLLSKNIIVSTNGTNNEKGSGLGITLIKDFMEGINGSLTIQSELGKGTSILLYFPK